MQDKLHISESSGGKFMTFAPLTVIHIILSVQRQLETLLIKKITFRYIKFDPRHHFDSFAFD
jgi:hypothetical protein